MAVLTASCQCRGPITSKRRCEPAEESTSLALKLVPTYDPVMWRCEGEHDAFLGPMWISQENANETAALSDREAFSSHVPVRYLLSGR